MLISVPSINHSRILVKTNKSWLIFSSFLFFSVFFRHFWPSYNFDSYQIMSLSTRVGCCTVLSCNDPFSLVNEVHKLLDNSGSDWPFHVKFSGDDLWVKGIKFMHMWNVDSMHWIVGMFLSRLEGRGPKWTHTLF